MSEREKYTVEIIRDAQTRIAFIELWHDEKGNFHREGGPSRIHRDRNSGAVVAEFWEQHGILHRDDGPAVIKRRPDGHIYFSERFIKGEKIKPQRPARLAAKTKKPPSRTNG